MNLTERVETSTTTPNPSYEAYAEMMDNALTLLEQHTIKAAAPVIGIADDGWTAYVRDDAQAEATTLKRGEEAGALYDTLTAVLGYVERNETDNVEAGLAALGEQFLALADTMDLPDPRTLQYRAAIESIGELLTANRDYLASGAYSGAVDTDKLESIAQGLEAIASGRANEFYDENSAKLPSYPGVIL